MLVVWELKLKEIAKYKIVKILTFIGNNSIRYKILQTLVLHNPFPAYHMQQFYFKNLLNLNLK